MSKLNLLLLEDDVDDAELIVKTLERSGLNFNHEVVFEIVSFLNSIENNTYDAILADNSLPTFNATKALEILIEHEYDIPFILVTGSISEEFAVDIMKLGAWDYILKDRLQRLPNAILSAVNKYALEKERQRYLEEIIWKEALMKEAELLAHFGSWQINRLDGVEHWSDEKFRILGYEPGGIVPSYTNFLNCVHPGDKLMVQNIVAQDYDASNRKMFQCRIVSAKGELKYLTCEMVAKRNTAGEVLQVNGITRDISDAIVAEQMFRKSEANLKTIFDNTESGYILLDTAFNIVSYNQKVYQFSLLQLEQPFAEGADLLTFYSNEKQQILNGLLQSALNGFSVKQEIPYTQNDGTSKWYLTGCHTVLNAEKKPIGIIFSQTDITTRKLMELQEKIITTDLIQRKNELEQFTFIISHNLRTPVANLLGISNLLKSENLDGDDKEFLLEGLTTSVEKLDSIIVDLNNIIQTKQSVNESRELVYFQTLVDDILFSIAQVIKDKNISIECSFGEVDCISTVKAYIYSIFYNLISNSVKYRQVDIPLVVKIISRKLGQGVELTFEDNGLGIDLTRKANQVFGLYKRFHIEAAEGKGMGLFMVKTHVETLGGKIDLESEVNKGTKFIIRFNC